MAAEMKTQATRVRLLPEGGSDSLRPYLPSTLLESAVCHESSVWWEWLEGSLMHCDISGFTAMSERLASLGKEGAELMVGVLNRFFESMLEIAAGHGGVQMKFGGDAMLLYFGGERHAVRAAACGLAMQRAMKPFGRVRAGRQEHTLKMRAGIHSGRFFSVSGGDPDHLLHYVLTGEDVSRAAIVEEHTGLGQVCVSAEAAGQLGESARLGKCAEGLFTVRSADAASLPTPGHPGSRPAVVDLYLAPSIRHGLSMPGGEHRRVTAVFINVLGFHELLKDGEEDRALEVISAFLGNLTAALEKHGGHLLGSDVADDGDKFIALFGAPVAAVGQESAAMRFALDLREEVRRADLPIRLRTGINTAFVFAGDVGSRDRREYTVIGDGVNLAARLMAAAGPGEIIVSKATAEAAQGFALQRLRPIKVKGKTAPVAIERLTGTKEGQADAIAPLVGRDEEIARLMQVASSASRGAGRIVQVWGEPGIGKSRLAAELMTRLQGRSWTVISGACQPHTRGTPFGAWSGLMASGVARETARVEVERVLQLLDERERNEGDPRARREAAVAGISDIVRRVAGQGKLLLLLEDIHWADESSLAVLRRLASEGTRGLLVCMTSLYPPGDGLEPDVAMELGELDEQAARRLVGASVQDPVRLTAAIERAQGNPLFLTEFVRAGTPGAVPDTLNDLMTARIDTLRPEERHVLRAAAVAGPRFHLGMVQELAKPLEAGRTAVIMPVLVERGFARQETGEEATYSFTHALLSEVAYESAPFAWRRRLHARAGSLLEEEHSGAEEAVSEALLHHFERAGDAGKAVRYAVMSGDRSAGMFANSEAIVFYDRALVALDRLGRGRADRSLLLERVGDILEVSGHHHEASQKLAEALSVFQESRTSRPRFIKGPVVVTGRESAVCRKIAVATEHASDYDEALRWLERAREALPRRAARLRAQVYATTCGVLFRKGRYAEAIVWGRQAVRTARGASDPRPAAYAQNMMAAALIEAGRLKEAVRYLRRAVKAYHETGDFAGQASSNNNLGSTYQLLGMYDAALYYYGVAMVADERTGDEIDAAIVHNNMAETLLLLNREDEAIERLREVLRIAAAEPDLADLEGWAHVTTARCHRAMGELREAARHLRRGTWMLRKMGSLGLLTEAMVDAAEQSLAEGNVRLAKRRAAAALRQAQEIDSKLALARAERVLGECSLMEGREHQGESQLLAALGECRRVAAEYEEARTAVVLARHYLDRGRKGAARRLARWAYHVFSRCGSSKQAELAAMLLKAAAS
jgi:class 3 adenylate cyclase/tetratricopeptide (TPR) repeat protein